MERALVYGELSRDSLKLCEHLSKVEAQNWRGNGSRDWQERRRRVAIGEISTLVANRHRCPICQGQTAKHWSERALINFTPTKAKQDSVEVGSVFRGFATLQVNCFEGFTNLARSADSRESYPKITDAEVLLRVDLRVDS